MASTLLDSLAENIITTTERVDMNSNIKYEDFSVSTFKNYTAPHHDDYCFTAKLHYKTVHIADLQGDGNGGGAMVTLIFNNPMSKAALALLGIFSYQDAGKPLVEIPSWTSSNLGPQGLESIGIQCFEDAELKKDLDNLKKRAVRGWTKKGCNIVNVRIKEEGNGRYSCSSLGWKVPNADINLLRQELEKRGKKLPEGEFVIVK